MTAIKISKKEIKERKDTRWVIYTDSLSSMLVIETNSENHPIQSQIFDILSDLYNQGKLLTLYKVPVHMGVKGNEETDKTAKQAIDT